MAGHKATPRSAKDVPFFADAPAIEARLGSQDKDVLVAIAASAALNEDLALAFLKRRDLPQAALESVAKNGRAMKSRKVKMGVVQHPKTPRHVTLPLVRHMYTFELMQVTLTPAVAADLRMAIEDVLVGRLTTLTAGERLTLARRSSGRVAAALLQDADKRVVEAGLNNPYLTDVLVVKALLQPKTSELLPTFVCRHAKWSVRKEVRLAALRNAFTPLAAAIRFAEGLGESDLSELLHQSALPENIKTYLLDIAQKRPRRR
jgi:hypothetical protein